MGSESSNQTYHHEEVITILSIDGGGVRGIIPSIVLSYLESILQCLEKNKEVRIADYFDFISGTSTGGLITAMLTAPDHMNRPLFSAKEIVNFYSTESENIFQNKYTDENNQSLFLDQEARTKINNSNIFEVILDVILAMTTHSGNFIDYVLRCFASCSKIPAPVRKKIMSLLQPKYDGYYLHETIKERLGKEVLISETITNVIIPTFDIKRFRPIIFSTLKAKRDESMDPPLSDVCIATSAAPYYFPPYYFRTSKDFNLVDGSVATNNPSLLAVCEVIKEKKIDCRKILVLSLGTGSATGKDRLEVGDASQWGIINWLWKNDNSHPLLDILMTSADEMIGTYMSSIFQSCGLKENYIRIQADLSYVEAALDNSSNENLSSLVKIGEDLVEKNEDILTDFAKRLVDLRKARLLTRPV